MIESLSWITLGFATISAVLYVRNQSAFRKSPAVPAGGDGVPRVSVLIPARDEERVIRATLTAVLGNRDVDLEVLVLDDQSQDATAAIVTEMAQDQRLRLVRGESLPAGWCGKQYACYQLSRHARHDELLFIDADVTLAPDAIRRCVAERVAGGADLISGFPRQIVGTLGEALLIPLIHIILLTYLPFRVMRNTSRPSASAGCGQLFLTSREAYQQSGGHAAIRASMHDGVTLPRAYRRAGLKTDIFDASDVARCRMYRGWSETIHGVLKNAHEGIANARLIVPATSLMVMGYLAPVVLAGYQLVRPDSTRATVIAVLAATISYLPRVMAAVRFDRAWLATALFPVSILLFVVLQWIAFLRRLLGAKPSWRGRSYASDTV